MKKHNKPVWLILALAVVLFSGCSALRVTTDLQKRILASSGSTDLTLQEFTFLLMDCQNRYNLYYTGLGMTGFWETETGGVSFADQVKNSELKEEVCTLLLLDRLAREKGISLTAENRETCRRAAENYLKGLSEPEILFCGDNADALKSLYEKYGLAEKVIAEICNIVEDEVSDNDKRVILLQVISCRTRDEAQQAAQKLKDGESFKSVAEQFSTLQIVDYQVTRGVLNPILEEKAFHMSDGEVSDIIETGDAFYLLKCVNDFDQGLSRTYEESTLDGIRYAIWSQELADYAKDHKVAVSSGLWEHITFSETTAMKTTNLYTNFRNFWKSQNE